MPPEPHPAAFPRASALQSPGNSAARWAAWCHLGWQPGEEKQVSKVFPRFRRCLRKKWFLKDFYVLICFDWLSVSNLSIPRASFVTETKTKMRVYPKVRLELFGGLTHFYGYKKDQWPVARYSQHNTTCTSHIQYYQY